MNLIGLLLTMCFSFVATQGAWADETTILVEACEPVVTLTCSDITCFNKCTTCIARIECDDQVREDTYTWEINGEVTTASTGNTLEICDLSLDINAIVATATSRENKQGSAGILLPSCDITVEPETMFRSRWIPLPNLITIEAVPPMGFRSSNIVEYSGQSPISFLRGAKWVSNNESTFNQIILVMPSILTGMGWDGSCEIITCSIEGFTDTFEICPLTFPF